MLHALKTFIAALLLLAPTLVFSKPRQMRACEIHLLSADVLQAFNEATWGVRTFLEQQADQAFPGRAERQDGQEVDTGEILAERVEKGDPIAEVFVELGCKIEENSGRKRALMPRVQDVFARYYAKIRVAMKEGRVREEDVIYPALVFIKRTSVRKSRLSIHKDDLALVRPGLDPWPDPEVFTLDMKGFQLNHTLWEDALAGGRLPFSVNGFVMHDLAHLAEFYHDIDLMAATRAFYRNALTRPIEWRNAQEVDLQAALREERELSEPQLHYLRTNFQSEGFVLPNLANAAAVRALIPGFFAENGPRSVEKEKMRLAGLKEEQLLELAERLLAARETVLTEMGGSQNDSYNVLKAQNEMPSKLAGAIISGKESVAYGPFLNYVSATHYGSLEGLLFEIAFIKSYNKDAMGGAYRANAFKLLIDRMARFEMGLYMGVELGLTPAQVIRDNFSQRFDPASLTGRFLKSFVPEESMLWMAYFSGYNP